MSIFYLISLYILLTFTILLFIFQLFLNLPKKKIEKKYPEYTGKVLVMVPCKNIDYTMKDNLSSLKYQDYTNYDLIAIIDSKDDPAFKVVNELGIRYILTNYECQGCSGKVRAL